jgi:hypothetical protein
MFVRRSSALLLCVMVVIPCAAGAQQRQQTTCAMRVPDNVDAGIFERDVMTLASRSETFRAQCERLAQASRVRVRIGMVTDLESGRAQTVIHRFSSGVIHADIAVLFGENYRELLAHEFEHILEQVDGVNLTHEAAQGRAWLLPGGFFETRRAFATGMQVLREIQPAPASRGVNATR